MPSQVNSCNYVTTVKELRRTLVPGYEVPLTNWVSGGSYLQYTHPLLCELDLSKVHCLKLIAIELAAFQRASDPRANFTLTVPLTHRSGNTLESALGPVNVDLILKL